eukprot:981635_1
MNDDEYIDVDELAHNYHETAGALRDDDFKTNINNNVVNEQNVMDDMFNEMDNNQSEKNLNYVDDDMAMTFMLNSNDNKGNVNSNHEIQISQMNVNVNNLGDEYDDDIDDIPNVDDGNHINIIHDIVKTKGGSDDNDND